MQWELTNISTEVTEMEELKALFEKILAFIKEIFEKFLAKPV